MESLSLFSSAPSPQPSLSTATSKDAQIMSTGREEPISWRMSKEHESAKGFEYLGSRRSSRITAIATGGEYPYDPFYVADLPVKPKRAQKVAKKQEKVPRELLSEMKLRKKKELEAGKADVGLEEAASAVNPPARKEWPFLRKWWKPEETEARQLTRRIVNLGKRRQLDQIFEILAAARKEGKKVNVITMNAAMSACVNCGDIDMALDLFDEMTDQQGCGVDSITYGTLLKGLGQAKRLDDAFELLEMMEAGTAPGRPQLTDVHLNTLVNACAEAGEAHRARSILQRYRSYGAGLGPSSFTYNVLVKGYARSDNPLEALKVMDEMHLLGLPLQRITYNSLILACIRGGDLERALDLFDEMKVEALRLDDEDLRPDVYTYTTLLKGLGEEKNLAGVQQLAAEMKGSNHTLCIDRIAFSVIIDSYLAAGSAKGALEVLEEMEERAKKNPQLRPRAHVFLSLMRAFAAQGDHLQTRSLAERFVRDSSGHVWPEERAEADELVLEASVSAGMLQEASLVLERMAAAQKDKLRFSDRAMHSLVVLHAVHEFPLDKFQPVPLSQEISMRATVDSLMIPTKIMPHAQPNQTVSDILPLFASSPFVVVLNQFQSCVGIIHASDCRWSEAQVSEVMRTPPPTVLNTFTAGQAAIAMLNAQCPVVAVVEEMQRIRPSKGKSFPQGESTWVVGFLPRSILFNNDPCGEGAEPDTRIAQIQTSGVKIGMESSTSALV